jgi:hypothetical protein
MTDERPTQEDTGRAGDRAWQRIAQLALLLESALAQAVSEDGDEALDLAGARRLVESMRYSL